MFTAMQGAGLVLLFALNTPAQVEIGGMMDRAGPVSLESVDGRRVTMSNYSERPATAVLFLSARCDATRDAIKEINGVNAKYRLRGLLLVGVFSNAAEDGEEVRSFAHRSGFLFPVYRDPGRHASTRFGSKVTPEAFLLDAEGVLRYRGAVAGIAAASAQLLAKQPVEPSALAAAGTPLGSPLPKRETADPHGSISFSSELIFETIPGAPAHHSPAITEAPNGDLLAVWYGGSYESSDDQTLFLARRRKGVRTWETPLALVRDSAQPPGNAVIFTGAGRVWIIWARMEASRPLRRGGGWHPVRLMYRISSDNGANWSADQPVDTNVQALPRNPPVRSASGGLLLPLGGSDHGKLASFFLHSSDGGLTWRRSAGAALGGGQPALVERQDGSLLMLMRSDPRVLSSESRDGGQTWNATVRTALRCPNSGVSLTRLANGNLVTVFNDSESDRTPLSVARSLDGGRTWEKPLVLEANPGEYSYPYVIQTVDGQIHITYTFRRYSIRHVEFNEGWLDHLQRPN